MHIAGIARAFPAHYYSQQDLTAQMAAMWSEAPFNPTRLRSLHQNVLVDGRYTALPLGDYPALTSFTASNQAYLRVGGTLACEVARKALHDANAAADALDHLFFVSVTGIGTPSLDARVCNELGLRSDIKRTPIFGLGCVAGAAGLARAADYLRGFPTQTALLLSVELCSLTLQRDDRSIAGLIASGLFGDGAAAVVLRGEQAPRTKAEKTIGPCIVASRSVFYPNTERMLGWDITSEGFRVVLSGELPALLGSRLRSDVDAFLLANGLCCDALASVVCHPGGPKVMETIERQLHLDEGALRFTRASLRTYGNLSSASVLLILEDTMRKNPAPPGAHSLLMAFGPGFCCELVLLQW